MTAQRAHQLAATDPSAASTRSPSGLPSSREFGRFGMLASPAPLPLAQHLVYSLIRGEHLDIPPSDYEKAKSWAQENGYAVFEIDLSLPEPWILLYKQITGQQQTPDDGNCRVSIDRTLGNCSSDKIVLFAKNPHATTHTHDLGAIRALSTYSIQWEGKRFVIVTSIPDTHELCDCEASTSPFYNIFHRTSADHGVARWPNLLSNPYSRGPAKEKRFHGRLNELQELQRPGSSQSVAVTGFYKTGKTSLLLEYMRLARAGAASGSAGACSVEFISAEGIERSSELYHQILKALDIKKRTSASGFLGAIRDADKKLSDSGRRCVLLIDEFSAITQLADKTRVLSTFHALVDQLTAIRLVYALHPHAIISINSTTSRFLPSLITLPIGPLEAEHIDAMINRAGAYGKSVSPEARQCVHELSGGHAFLAEELLRLAFDAAESEIDPSVLAAVVCNGGLLEMTETISQVWQRMTPVERDLLRVVLDNPNPTRFDLLTAPRFEVPEADPAMIVVALEFLAAKAGVLEVRDGSYGIRGGLIQMKLEDIRTIERARQSK